MAFHNDFGKKGEELAAKFLLEKGYKILELNWQHKKEEIDIIAEKDDILAIVEVKTRSGNLFGEPEVFVTRQKQRNIIVATQDYIDLKNLSFEVRFDIISVLFSNNQFKINHIEGAFYPTL